MELTKQIKSIDKHLGIKYISHDGQDCRRSSRHHHRRHHHHHRRRHRYLGTQRHLLKQNDNVFSPIVDSTYHTYQHFDKTRAHPLTVAEVPAGPASIIASAATLISALEVSAALLGHAAFKLQMANFATEVTHLIGVGAIALAVRRRAASMAGRLHRAP